MTTFREKLKKLNLQMVRNEIKILQLNVGNLCNQQCINCHIEASPFGKNNMTRETAVRIIDLLKKEPQIHTVDITGGAPELNLNFEYLVSEIAKLGKKIIDRCNLTVLLEDGQEDMITFLAKNKVQIYASIPCYNEENAGNLREEIFFTKSIESLKKLNNAGYGIEGSGLMLNIVYNPFGAFLPANQDKLERGYKEHLYQEYGIFFNNLIAVPNMPIKRFALWLYKHGILDKYMNLLESNFNPKAIFDVVCTRQISIGWDGKIYDCDFNYAIGLHIDDESSDIWKVRRLSDITKHIQNGDHCYGCMAGRGNECVGALC